MTTTVGGLLAGFDVVVCTGAGGVGKTTTAAALAMEGARRGQRACVVTIDPAKRLANAMGLEGLTNSPTRVELPDDLGATGELWALMLDTESTFDDLVAKHSESPEQASSILSNRFYRNIAGALSGTQEYMAMEKLYELHQEGGFDLIVVDTPPTRNALDFLDAPRRLTHFLDHRLYRVLVSPTRGIARAVNLAAQAFLRTVSKVVGAEAVRDAVTFFQAFDGMEAGFKERASHVLGLLSDDATAFVLVTTPRKEVVGEATFFFERLDEAGIPVRALVVNRIHPRFGTEEARSPAPGGLRRPGGAPLTAATASTRARELEGTDLGALYANLADFASVADGEEEHLAGLTERVAPAPVVRVPFFSTDVHDLASLVDLATHLVETDES